MKRSTYLFVVCITVSVVLLSIAKDFSIIDRKKEIEKLKIELASERSKKETLEKQMVYLKSLLSKEKNDKESNHGK